MKWFSLAFLLLVGVSMSACVTEQSNVRPADPEKAAQLYAQLGFGYLKRQRYDLAEQKFLKARQLNDKRVDAAYGLGLVRFAQGQTIEGRALIDEAAKRVNSDEKLRPVIAQWYCDARFPENAENLLEPLIKTGNPNAVIQWSNCLNDNGDTRGSEVVVLDALRKNPLAGQYLLFMASRSVEQSDWLRADMFLKRYSASSPPSSQSLLLELRTAIALGDEEARASSLLLLEQVNPVLLQKIDRSTGEFLQDE